MEELIRNIRKAAQLNQEQFAEEIGTTALSINRWENGKSTPNKMAQSKLFEFCEKHDIDMYEYIVGWCHREPIDERMILYHGSKKGIVGDIAPISRDMCDFGSGFYMGTEPGQPLTLICDEKKPVFYTLAYDFTGLKILDVKVNLEWAMLISYYRGYMDEVKGSRIYEKYANMANGYDLILGYIANDRMFRVMKNFFEGGITDIALIHCLSALDLGRQYVAITDKACRRAEILSQKPLSPLELEIIKKKSKINREKGLQLTDEILLKYRREGRYFDEILRGDSI